MESVCFEAYFLHQLSIIMTADGELDGISETVMGRNFVGFSREELGIHSDVKVEKYQRAMIKLLCKLLTKNGQEP